MGELTIWYGVSFLLILLVPPQLWLGVPVWKLTPPDALQVWVWGATFLLFATILGSRRASIRPVSLALIAAGCWGAGYAMLLVQPEARHSRGVAMVAIALGLILAVLPFLVRGLFVPGGRTLAALAIVVALIGSRKPVDPPFRTGFETADAGTALHQVSIGYHRGIADRIMDGGAITTLGDGFLLVTAEGAFRRLEWAPDRIQLRNTLLSLTAPLNRAEFLAQRAGDRPLFRVTDLALDTSSSVTTVYVAHQHWDTAGKCINLRVSSTTLDSAARATRPWKQVYETRPCLTMSADYMHNETGGRLAWYGGALLLTVGDHGLHHDPALAQDSATDYGKILQLDLAGGRTLMSLGHRNPQGLMVGDDGRIWSTEHGPQGGDEINLIERGSNYGWPLRTHGTEYGLRYWPHADSSQDAARFTEPVHAFVPAIGISNLLQVGPGQFPEWQGDLLVASLMGRALYRVRLDGSRVAYLERIPVDRRIRDLAQGRDGRIVMWTDEGDVLTLAEARARPLGELAYGRCAGCHGADLAGSAIGPSLRGVLGRDVAMREDFPYSAALRALRGKWSRERLDAFLRAPGDFVPGTSMKFDGISDPGERQALIDFLWRAW